MKLLLLPALLSLNITILLSQEIIEPYVAFTTHPTMAVQKISETSSGTTFIIRITSQIPDGQFCIDQNTSIMLPNGQALRMLQAINIPTCPEVHRFHNTSESLTFSLSFPALPAGTACVDLEEGCDMNCFSLRGIVTDASLNNAIQIASDNLLEGNIDKALQQYIDICESLKGKDLSAVTGLYSTIIQLWNRQGNALKVKEWIRKLKSEKPPHYKSLLSDLEAAGIRG